MGSNLELYQTRKDHMKTMVCAEYWSNWCFNGYCLYQSDVSQEVSRRNEKQRGLGFVFMCWIVFANGIDFSFDYGSCSNCRFL